jgi:hypothetical protein
MINGKSELETIDASLKTMMTSARIIDQNINACATLRDFGRGPSHFGQAAHVCADGYRSLRANPVQSARQSFSLLVVSAKRDNCCSLAGERESCGASNAGGCAGDHNGLHAKSVVSEFEQQISSK